MNVHIAFIKWRLRNGWDGNMIKHKLLFVLLSSILLSACAKKAEEEEKKMPGLNFEFEGESYKFKDSDPKKIWIAGKVYSQAEIVKKKDILLELVGGNSGLIQKVI